MSQKPPDPIAQDVETGDYSISQLARALGVDYHALRDRYFQGEVTKTFPVATGPEPDDIRSLGRPGLQRFVVAIKRRGGEWPERYRDAILLARRKYDAGTYEMFQGHHKEGWVVLYCLPRLVAVPRRDTFRKAGLA